MFFLFFLRFLLVDKTKRCHKAYQNSNDRDKQVGAIAYNLMEHILFGLVNQR